MIRAGMNVARINFSHGTHERHKETIDAVRQVAEEEQAVVAIMADIQGPKIRIAQIAHEPLILAKGDRITLTLDPADGSKNVVTLPHPEFLRDIKPETQLLIADGKLEFLVKEVTARALICEVVVGGELTSRKGVMATNAFLTLSAITDKDRADVEFALLQNVDYIAMSFVRSAEDIREMRWLIRHLGGDVAIIAKIEKHEALTNIDAIIEAADGIMVARGDLGLETPPEQVPFQQKRIIRLCNIASKPVITATQMLLSMVNQPRPTRAEASDVYNAIVDGTDAVMLSDETAGGQYPVESVAMMANIATNAEAHVDDYRTNYSSIQSHKTGKEAISDAISQSAYEIAETLNPKAIVTSTLTGYTARRVARQRPSAPILCVTPSVVTFRRMALVWGVRPLLVPNFNTIDEMISIIVRRAHEEGIVERGDSIVILAGVPFGVGGQTNLLKIHTVGEAGEI